MKTNACYELCKQVRQLKINKSVFVIPTARSYRRDDKKPASSLYSRGL